MEERRRQIAAQFGILESAAIILGDREAVAAAKAIGQIAFLLNSAHSAVQQNAGLAATNFYLAAIAAVITFFDNAKNRAARIPS